ncbi:uncharacterized protein LOC21404231 [Morus notabilis]|uniref:uncharacterized protein LOC21404231 n=1 Tax=Morus notabilis TaxID=981085 RepID=UPI000CECFF51|nr:uncharacterized protein LOC21404231 [Morus notabilis]
MIKMLWKSIAQDKGCLPLDLLILNVALAFFSAILAVVAFFQLVRIHLREKEWTRQKVLHFMIGTSNTGYFIYFASTHFSTYEKWLCWYHVCGFVLMAYPKILFLAAFLLLLSFWVDLCHQANDEEDDDGENSTQQTLLANSTNKFGSSNTDGNWACCSFQNLHVGSCQNFVVAVVLLVFIVMVSFAMIIWIGARENFINSSIVAQVYEEFIASFLLVGGTLGCYGLLLSRKLRKVWSERASSEMWKVAGLAVTSVICFTSSALVAILTDIPLYYHWHLKKIYGVRAVLFLILYYHIRSLIPSAFVLWIMLELPPAITHREEQREL